MWPCCEQQVSSSYVYEQTTAAQAVAAAAAAAPAIGLQSALFASVCPNNSSAQGAAVHRASATPRNVATVYTNTKSRKIFLNDTIFQLL